jgi:hypothetical protein
MCICTYVNLIIFTVDDPTLRSNAHTRTHTHTQPQAALASKDASIRALEQEVVSAKTELETSAMQVRVCLLIFVNMCMYIYIHTYYLSLNQTCTPTYTPLNQVTALRREVAASLQEREAMAADLAMARSVRDIGYNYGYTHTSIYLP